jgi:uncharacterized protein (DUF433 family)
MSVLEHAEIAPHISLDGRGTAYIAGTQTKVMTVVQNKRAARNTPEQLQAAMPHLTLAQVYAALAYYHDHKAEIDHQIRQTHERAASILEAQPPSPSRADLLDRAHSAALRSRS